MSSSLAQKFKNIGPGALVAAGFIGPGTVTTCTVSGASYGYTMLWALLFATVATIIFQEMASRVGIVSGKGLGENIRDRIPNKALMWIAIDAGTGPQGCQNRLCPLPAQRWRFHGRV